MPASEKESTQIQIPDKVRRIELSGREIFLVPTAHVSLQSVEDVRKTIQAICPDVVCIELCEPRFKNLVNREIWKQTNLVQVIRQGNAMLLLASLVMASFQKRIGQRLGVKPGAEMEEGIRQAKEVGADLVLADRDIQITLKRTWHKLKFRHRIRMVLELVTTLFVGEEISAESIEELKEEKKLGDVLKLLAEEFPNLKSTLIDERDQFLAQKIRDAAGKRVVAVVGAGHVPGIVAKISQPADLKALEEIPAPSHLPQLFKWGLPMVILGLFVYGFQQGGAEESLGSLYIWILINGALAALGASIALGHPLTIVSAFLAAPLTSLNPMVAAGWVAGLVQCFAKKPTVRDLESLPDEIGSVKGFWMNPVSRILLVVVLSNVGSSLGTFISGGWIAARVLS